jgi:hypothetical protein
MARKRKRKAKFFQVGGPFWDGTILDLHRGRVIRPGPLSVRHSDGFYGFSTEMSWLFELETRPYTMFRQFRSAE